MTDVAIAQAWLRWNWEFHRNEQPFAQLYSSLWHSSRFRLTVDGATYRLYRKRWILGTLYLEKDGKTIGEAVGSNLRGHQFKIAYNGKKYVLKMGLTTSHYNLFHEKEKIGRIVISRAFRVKYRISVKLPDEIDDVGKVFLTSLATIFWKRESSIAGTLVELLTLGFLRE